MAKMMNRGAHALRRVMKAQNLSQGDVRSAVKAPNGLVSRWLSGDRKPGLLFASRLLAEYGISLESWLDNDPADTRAA